MSLLTFSVLRRFKAISQGPETISKYKANFQLFSRGFCERKMAQDVSYEELQEQLRTNSIVLIDVREQGEIQQVGKIEKSINIPLGKLKEALQLKNEEFEKIYNAKKPATTDKLVIHCHAGKRAIMASDVATQLGFSAIPYKGSFTDWVAKGGAVSH